MLNCIGDTGDTIFANISYITYITDIGETFVAGINNAGWRIQYRRQRHWRGIYGVGAQLIGTFRAVADHGESSWKVALWWLPVHMLYPQSTELTFVYRGSSHRCKSAACPKFNMVWLYCSPIPVGRREVNFRSNYFTCLPSRRGGRGGGVGVGTLWLYLARLLVEVGFMKYFQTGWKEAWAQCVVVGDVAVWKRW